ncbi:4'-phosphopantetheinyl transferase family protein [Cytobacillus dafuensis]|uniref:4'-phosphopantetheinyl transferase superfamily protein n=1 Tax=Cytobacillus dafuensis TaxID=1742359 RepID=A0A5B8Z2I9_CYTDA|nr:4'-phosphopantetheinyl transferase superfamily protein [Cytobacillus dafuensis]QED47037.1 4'-phosphopantetheinyl transferase superfamily protein [Cytobacillus dafuensis]
MNVFALKMKSEIPLEEFSTLLDKVTLERRKKILRFSHRDDGLRSLYSELLIRFIISNRHELIDTKIDFACNEFGKPYLRQAETSLHFNISHSGEWIVCVLDEHQVGIDVEEIRPIDLGLAKRFFSVKEVSELKETPKEKKLAKFYDLWTLKESYIKAVGKGLSIPLDSFSILTVKNENPTLIEKRESGHYFFKQFELAPGYKLSVCSIHNNFPGNIEKVHFTHIHEWFMVRS